MADGLEDAKFTVITDPDVTGGWNPHFSTYEEAIKHIENFNISGDRKGDFTHYIVTIEIKEQVMVRYEQ